MYTPIGDGNPFWAVAVAVWRGDLEMYTPIGDGNSIMPSLNRNSFRFRNVYPDRGRKLAAGIQATPKSTFDLEMYTPIGDGNSDKSLCCSSRILIAI